MKYHNITKFDMLNGDGVRTVLWVSGCTHKCKDCQNQLTWDINCGLNFDDAAKEELFNNLKEDYISGITFSGGDPLHPQNREEVGKLINEITKKFPKKTIWVYTGFLWEEVNTLPFMKNVDVLVDGKFVVKLKDNNLKWKGSSNQRVINVKQSLKQNKVILHCENY